MTDHLLGEHLRIVEEIIDHDGNHPDTLRARSNIASLRGRSKGIE